MSEVSKNAQGFIGYEYKDVTVKRSLEPLYADNYPNFGWQFENGGTSVSNLGSVIMKFKRDRKIRNKAELTKLQRQFEAAVDEIGNLEKSKFTAASIWAYTIGIIGCAFLAGSVFAITAATPNIPLCIMLGIPGLVGWACPYLLYRKVSSSRTSQVSPLIEQKYDEIYDICEKASVLNN